MANAENPPVTAGADVNGGVDELRRELARERMELATAVGRLEGSVAVGRKLAARRFAIVGGALVVSFVLAGGLSALLRVAIRRRRRDQVVARLGDLTLVRRPVRFR